MEHKAPDAFRTISEAAEELDLPQHVLRFWETRFRDIKPMKRGGGRRYYRPDDIDLLRGIRHLLYGEGYTIRGVQRILREHGVKFVQAVWQEGAPQPPHGANEETSAEIEIAGDEAQSELGLEEGRGLRGRLASLIGRDLRDRMDDAAERTEPPLEGAPTPRVEAVDRAIHGALPPEAPEKFSPAVEPPPIAIAPKLAPEQMRALAAALDELGECRRLLAAAVSRPQEAC